MKIQKCNQLNMEYLLIRSQRRTISISVKTDGMVEVRAPYFISVRDIERFLVEKETWIYKQKRLLSNRERKTSQCAYRTGETLLFIGRECSLVIEFTNKHRSHVSLQQSQIIMEIPSNTGNEERRQLLINWYREEARYILSRKVEEYTLLMNIEYGTIRIKDQRTCWGSCSSMKNLNFNYRIVMAPEPIINYIVIHELCHLKHMNHSSEFWRNVEKYDTDYRIHRQWLKDNGSKLNI